MDKGKRGAPAPHGAQLSIEVCTVSRNKIVCSEVAAVTGYTGHH